MSAKIIPLPRKGQEAPAFARVAFLAAEMLTEGQAVNLTAARKAVILRDLQTYRDELIAVIADLETRKPTGKIEIDTVNAQLKVAASEGLAQIALVIERLEALVENPTPSP
ncbi:hypothetical protein [Methylobacterium trifolii]|uniref:Uncharacterized protein n=1 Tax=Methylobacterium trifolii TaxID=1003092 RepID=A0ABQ4TV01_9HYPH|nr:hypothetical protein [Methylobacterium trifolii]GJE59114.1 hypothetical protein MPOCJGCO_1201 [Methylobacterium trifolii]